MDDEEMGLEAAESVPIAIPRIGAAQSRGVKSEMEDRHMVVASLHSGVTALISDAVPYCGVMDGHNGDLAAEIAASKLHTFLAKQVEIFDRVPRGSEQRRIQQVKHAIADAFAKVR
jgi:serine/threonine protein phosphatase PrpC